MRSALFLVALLLAACADGARELVPIHLEPVAQLGDSSGPGVLRGWARVSPLHPAGFRVLIPQVAGTRALPMRYQEGRGVLGTLGQWGSGPDGFERPLFTRYGPGDSLWVFDGSRRVLVFDRDGRFGRGFAVPLDAWDALVLGDGRVVAVPANTADTTRVVLLSDTGALLRSLPGGERGLRHLIAGPDGAIWALAVQSRWRAERWDTLTGIAESFERDPEWYPRYEQFSGPTRSTPPSPTLVDGWFDAAGRLWVLGKAADPRWKEGVTPASGIASDGSVVIADADRVYDTMLEVFDLRRDGETLVAQARLDLLYPYAAEAGVIGRMEEGAGGRRVALMRVVLDTARLRP